MDIIARKFWNVLWNVLKWIWLSLIFVVLISLATNLAVVQTTDLHKTVLVTVLNWFAQFGFAQILLLIAFGLFIVFTIVACIITMLTQYRGPAQPSIDGPKTVLFDEAHGQSLWDSPMPATIDKGYKRIKELTEEQHYTVAVLKDKKDLTATKGTHGNKLTSEKRDDIL